MVEIITVYGKLMLRAMEQTLLLALCGLFFACILGLIFGLMSVTKYRACRIILEYRDGANVCGIAKNIGREGESVRILSLDQLKDTGTDMFSTVFIGNSRTVELNGRMVTPRGYKDV